MTDTVWVYETDEEDYYDDPLDDDYWDDEDPIGYGREEPYCGACDDYGCHGCRPSRLRVWWWRFSDRLRHLRPRPHPLDPDEPPF